MEGFRLSPQQKRLWSQHTGQNWPYRAQALIVIEGHLDPEVLSAAIQDVIERHEILRTTFHHLPGLTFPVQVIGNNSIPSVPDHNLSGLDPREQDTKIEALLQEARNRPFDLERGPLVHMALLTVSPEKHLLLVVLSALCADTVGLHNLMREIGHTYAARLRHEERADDVMQYADIAEWQNELLEGEAGEVGRAFWRQQQVADWRPVRLPFENPLPGKASFEPRVLNWTIHPDLVPKIEALAQTYQTSTSVFLLTGWLILLGRVTGQPRLVVGVGEDGRKYEELKGALGLFANYLPLHCHLQANARFSDILAQVHQSAEAIHEWQGFFNWEQMESSGAKNGGPSFFPLCFDFADQLATFSAAQVSFSIQQQDVCVDRFKLRLSCVQRREALDTAFHYDSTCFRAEAIQRLTGQFHALLASAISRPTAAISELEILGDAERQQVLVEFNQTQADYPQDRCIHHLIEEQAARTPNDVAVVFEGQKLTYAELNAQANQLAHHLRSLGVGPDALIGICLERSLEMVVGILGILKAGGAYVPLDPTYPKERLGFMLADTQALVLLTQERLVAGLPEHPAHVICLDQWIVNASMGHRVNASGSRGQRVNESIDSLTHLPIVSLDSGATADNLAYVIYTSGSTGRPKGVLVTHQNLVHSTSARTTYYRHPVTRFLLLSSFAFDSSVAGIFWTLCQGGALVLPEPGLERDPQKLTRLIAVHQVSHLLSLPSLYELLLAQAQPEQLASLRAVIVAGEACPEKLTENHHQTLPRTDLFNEYGPTEGTVWSSVYHISSPIEGSPVPIGRPIANTQIYLLDDHLRPVPIGVPGELHVGGVGVTRGYLNRPELTAERFIPDPFAEWRLAVGGWRNEESKIQNPKSGLSRAHACIRPATWHGICPMARSNFSVAWTSK
jgi:amino acid adenylation domain-containing protein